METLNKKGQTNGLLTGLIFGVVALVIAIIIGFVIVSTLNDSGITSLSQNGGRTVTVTSENIITHGSPVYLNQTGYTLAYYNTAIRDTFTIVNVTNYSSGGILLSGNYTLTTGVLKNATATTFNNVSVTYTFRELNDVADRMIGNLTGGVDNVSGKIPTILLIGAIILILGILALLVGVWQRMRMGGSV